MNNWYGRIILFIIVGLGVILSLQYTTSHFKSERQIILLNRTLPDFQNLLNLEKQGSPGSSRGDLKEYFDYFQLVTGAMPGNSDGMLVLGYLDEATGNHARAAVMFKEAYRLDPQFFFTAFNLARVCFKQGDYPQSIELLQKALGVPPAATLNRMMSSMVYRQILSSVKDNGDIIAGLQQAYHDAYVLLVESMAHSGRLNAQMQNEMQGENALPEVHAHIM